MFRWQRAQVAALVAIVSLWVVVDVEPRAIRQGAGEWGAVVWHEKQLTAAPAPRKSLPWHP